MTSSLYIWCLKSTFTTGERVFGRNDRTHLPENGCRKSHSFDCCKSAFSTKNLHSLSRNWRSSSPICVRWLISSFFDESVAEYKNLYATEDADNLCRLEVQLLVESHAPTETSTNSWTRKLCLHTGTSVSSYKYLRCQHIWKYPRARPPVNIAVTILGLLLFRRYFLRQASGPVGLGLFCWQMPFLEIGLLQNIFPSVRCNYVATSSNFCDKKHTSTHHCMFPHENNFSRLPQNSQQRYTSVTTICNNRRGIFYGKPLAIETFQGLYCL